MSDFSDRPFVAGSLIGVRSFAVNPDGTLRGPVKPETWRAGVNTAECRMGPLDLLQQSAALSVAAVDNLAWSMHVMTCAARGVVNLKKKPKPKAAPEKPVHTLAGVNCKCGYYGYFRNRHNPHHSDGNILGIVEAFGTVTVGSRGFRASKARIIALVRNDDATTANDRYMFGYPGCGCGACRILAGQSAISFDKIAAHYDVPVFATLDAALAEYPLTVPEGTPKEDELEAAITYGRTFVVPNLPTVPVVRWQFTDTMSAAFKRLARAFDDALDSKKPESPKERALRLRRERNTGPADTRNLDGTRRRTA